MEQNKKIFVRVYIAKKHHLLVLKRFELVYNSLWLKQEIES